MVREVCSEYTGTKKEYRKSGCTKCDSYGFYNGRGYDPNAYYCKRGDSFKVVVIPFRLEEDE